MTKDKDGKMFTVTVEFTDDAEPVTATEVPGDDLNSLYGILGEEVSRARLWTDSGRLVMFPGRFIRSITAILPPETEETPEAGQ